VYELIDQAAANTGRFGRDFFTGLSIKSGYQPLVCQWTESGHIALIIDENDRRCGPEQLQGPSTCFGVEFLATAPQQMALQEVVGE
jgi:hypothetical protein